MTEIHAPRRTQSSVTPEMRASNQEEHNQTFCASGMETLTMSQSLGEFARC